MKTTINQARCNRLNKTGWILLSAFLFLPFLQTVVRGQAPERISYQAVVRDTDGIPLSSAEVSLRLSIHAGTANGTLLWQEEQSLSTSAQGLVSLKLGDPENRTGGTLSEFESLGWGTNLHFLEIEINTGSGYTSMGSTQMVSVPYALYAKEAASAPGSDLWNGDAETVRTALNVGIGTDNPAGKLEVIGNAGSQDDEPLFEVKRNDGQAVFSVYNEGVRIWVMDDWAKGTKGGFAVGGFNPAKGETNEFMLISPDSIRMYVENVSKASKGGFAVGGFSPGKADSPSFLQLSRDNYFIGHESGKENTSGLYNAFIGYGSGSANTTGNNNVFIGFESGITNKFGENNVFVGTQAGGMNLGGNNNTMLGNNAGFNNSGGNKNTLIGNRAGFGLTNGGQNVFVGDESGQGQVSGYYNVFIGTNAGYTNSEGSSNVFIGQNAGLSNTGSGNIFIGPNAGSDETGSNKLFIDNGINDANTALFYGDFESDEIRFNASIGIFAFPEAGTALTVNGNIDAADYLSTSDSRFKTDVSKLDGALQSVLRLQGVSYYWNAEDFPERQFSTGKQIGLIAQEVEKVVPELVITGQDGFKSLNYTRMPALLVEAIKEQQNTILRLEERIALLEAYILSTKQERNK